MFFRKARIYWGILFYTAWHILFPHAAASFVIEKGNQTFLLDHTGEKWDITQARSIGFSPEDFEFGIGRNAFTPLDDTHWTPNLESVPQGLRVIGVTDGDQAQAYSVSRLTRHEIANTTIGSKSIAVGY